MTEPNHPPTPPALSGISRPSPDSVRAPQPARDAAEDAAAIVQDEAGLVPHEAPERPPRAPLGDLFLPVERASEEFEQLFGRRPSIFEVAAGVASRPDLVEPVDAAALRWPRSTPPGLADSWFLTESVGERPRLELEQAAIAAALLECLDDWEEQVMRSRVEPHMTQLEVTHAIAFSQLRASLALMRGLEWLDIEVVPRPE